jgi:AAA domain
VAFHRAEQSLATGLLALLNSRQERLPAFAAVDWAKALRWLHARTGQDLAPGQQEAAQLALTQKVAVLTGGPGCGKSFTVRSIVGLATAARSPVADAEHPCAVPSLRRPVALRGECFLQRPPPTRAGPPEAARPSAPAARPAPA